jgi:hypothetical protein
MTQPRGTGMSFLPEKAGPTADGQVEGDGDMMRLIAGLVVAFALVAGPAAAQSSADLKAFGDWSQGAAGVIARAVEPFKVMPQPPASFSRKEARKAWTGAVRTWLVQARSTLAAERVALAALRTPPPIDPRVDEAVVQTQRRTPGMLDGIGAFYDRLEGLAAAIERNDPDAISELGVAMMDASMTPLSGARDINDLSAAALGPSHPQTYILRCMARSYDALIVNTRMTRAALETLEDVDLAPYAEGIETAAAEMRREVASGRVALEAMHREIAVMQPRSTEEAALIAKLPGMMDTYPASFELELQIAATLDALARHYRSARTYNAIDENTQDAHLQKIAELDETRLARQFARAQMITGP